ncbi:MAG: EamA family transporter [Lachnospiraceae bacterium]|nr:EamA family transporter [Lachnospiraceae bacterium]
MTEMTALIAAFLSAVFASASTLLVKCFVRQTDSVVVTSVQAAVMLVFSAAVCLVSGSFSTVASTGIRSILFMAVSGISTGMTWLYYFRALQEGDADKVMPIEKANIFLTILIAVFFFHEKSHLPFKMAGAAVILFGLILLLTGSARASQGPKCGSCRWLKYALLSSFFAALNTIFSKLALAGMNSNFGTLLNTAVALVIAALFLSSGKNAGMLRAAPRREVVIVAISGISTAFNWLLYYYAVKNAPMTAVAPLNKLSVPIVILFSRFVLGSGIRKDQGIGLACIVAGMMMVAAVA